jgi:hypothetical protein
MNEVRSLEVNFLARFYFSYVTRAEVVPSGA